MSVRKCRDRVSCDVFDFFIMGEDGFPEWYYGGGVKVPHGNYVVRGRYSGWQEYDIKAFNERFDVMDDVSVKKCMHLHSGEICEYFVFGSDDTPGWFGDRSVVFFESGNIVVSSKEENTVLKFTSIDDFKSCYHYGDNIYQGINEERVIASISDDERVGYTVPPSSGKRCIHRGSGIECDYFVWDIDAVPGWCDIVALNGELVVCDPYGMILVYSLAEFGDRYKPIEYYESLLEGKDRCFRYMDGREFNYEQFENGCFKVYIGKEYDIVMHQSYFHMCFSVRGSYGEPIKADVENVGVFGNDDGSVLGSAKEEAVVDSQPDEYVDINRSGECMSKKFPDDTVFEYFIYSEDSKWYPDWFPNKIKDHYAEHLDLKEGDYLVCPKRSKGRGPSNNMDKKAFDTLFEITKPYLPDLWPTKENDIVDSLASEKDVVKSGIVGKCRSKETGNVYNYFIVDSGKEPDWFNHVDEEILLEVKNGYEGKIYATHSRRIILHQEDLFFGLFDIVDDNIDSIIPADEGIFEDESIVVNKCPVEGYAANDTEKVNLVIAARFCKLKSGPKFIHEYFIFGYDAVPDWFKEVYPQWQYNNNGVVNFPYVVWLVEDVHNKKVLFLKKDDFEKYFEVVFIHQVGYKVKEAMEENGGPIDVVDAAKELKINDAPFGTCRRKDENNLLDYVVYREGYDIYPDWFDLVREDGRNIFDGDYFVYDREKNKVYVNRQDDFSKNYVISKDYAYVSIKFLEKMAKDPANWKEEEVKSLVSEGRICYKKGNDFYFNFFVYGVDNYPSWYDDKNIYHERLKEGDWVVRDFSDNKYDFDIYLAENHAKDIFEEIEDVEFYDNSVIVDRDKYNEIKEQIDLLKLLPDANQWFKKLAPEVFRYLVIRDMNSNDGMVNMLKLYKLETNGRN